jgi:predicted DNA-binding transcriptional regulator AlpA
MTDKLLCQKQVRQIVPVCSVTLWSWVKAGKFPKPVKVGGRIFWKQTDIETFIANSGQIGAGVSV